MRGIPIWGLLSGPKRYLRLTFDDTAGSLSEVNVENRVEVCVEAAIDRLVFRLSLLKYFRLLSPLVILLLQE